MSRSKDKDLLQNPAPVKGVKKETTDTVLTILKIGNGLVSLLSGLLAAVLILYSSYVLYDSFKTEYNAYSSAWDLLKYKPEITDANPDEGADVLAAINQDYRAWLTIYDTTIDYPVVQGANDLYYASHDVYNNVSLTGAIYLASQNKRDFTDSYNLIYGHHMDNGAMFGSLDKFMDPDYFNAHKKGVVVTESGVYDIELFAVAKTDAYENQIYTTGNRLYDVLSFLTGSRENDTGIGTQVLIYDAKTAMNAKKIIAFSTCADAETNGRLVVLGRMIYRGTQTPEPTTEKPTETPDKKPVATETPAPETTKVKLTVYYLENNKKVFPTVEKEFTPGDSYYIKSPYYPGYTVDLKEVSGTIQEDTILYVHYTPNEYRLTIQYIYEDGTQAAETYTAVMLPGDLYDIPSPNIEGYKPTSERISGVNPGRNEQYTVIYIPKDADTDNDEQEVYLDRTCIQIGIEVE